MPMSNRFVMFGADGVGLRSASEPDRGLLVRFSSWPLLRDRQCRHAALCCPIETSSDVGMIGMITRRAWSYRVGAFFLPYVIPAAPPVRFLVATGPPSTKALTNNGEPFGTFFRRVRHAYVQSLRYVRRRWSWASTAET